MQNTILLLLTLCIFKIIYGESPDGNSLVYEALHLSSKTIKINNTSWKQNDSKAKEQDAFKLSEQINPDTFYKMRSVQIEALQNISQEYGPYPDFTVKVSLRELIEKYKDSDVIKEGEVLLNTTVSVAGRVHDIKRTGERVISYIYYVRSDGLDIQVISTSNAYKSKQEFEAVTNTLKRGDIVGCVGHPGKDDHHNLVVVAKSIKLLSPCLIELPDPVTSFENLEDRFRKRYLDLILNDKPRQIFYTRAKIIAYIRQYLDSLGFLEVETPILNMVPGGATANLFVTHLDEVDMDLFLRISPELYHKMLVVGGINRIYEIGRQFRNEGVDTTHNPEFTSCEFYMAYADYNDLINMTEIMLSDMVKSIHGSYKIKYHPNGPLGEELEIDFTPPFAKVSMMGALEQELNVTLPPADQLETPEANAFLSALCEQHEIEISPPRTTSRLIDKLVGKFVQDKCINPTFILDYPQIMSPYAKAHRDVPGLTERFELYVSKKEVCNAYSELSDPAEQARRWQQQARDRAAGDIEVPPTWPEYLAALELGMPPAAGWGAGVDRLVMLLTDSPTIKEVILFPAAESKDPKSSGDEK